MKYSHQLLPSIALGIGFLLHASFVHATVLSNPSVAGSAAAFSGSYLATNVFDNASSEYASSGQGSSTYIDFDFGSTTTFDGFVNVTRANGADIVGDSRLILDTDGILGFNEVTDTVINFTAANTGSNGRGYINRFGSVSAQRVRWDVVTSVGTSPNLGATEMRFLNTASGRTVVNGVTAINAATAFNAAHAFTNAANGIAGLTTVGNSGVEYASAGAGANTFVDFDMGAIIDITGFDFFDRLAAADHVGTFDLIFSNDATFATTVATKNYNKGTAAWTISDDFDAITARYVRYDVTGTAPTNAGLGDLVFYSVPEPSTYGLIGAGALAAVAMVRRRRKTAGKVA